MRNVTRLAILAPAFALLLSDCSSPSVPERPVRGAADAPSAADLVGAPDARDERSTPNAARAEADVSRASAAEVQAFLGNDLPTLERLWSDAFIVTNPFNQLLDKQQVVALVASGALAFTAYTRDIEYAHAYGNVVIVAGSETVVWAGKSPLAGKTSLLRYTAVWARHGESWQEVARHASMVSTSG